MTQRKTDKNDIVFCVYIDKTDAGDVYYCGKTRIGAQRLGLRSRGMPPRPGEPSKHDNVMNKYGLHREIVFQSLDEDEAYLKENELVEFYQLNMHKYPNNQWATNASDGGRGPSTGFRSPLKGIPSGRDPWNKGKIGVQTAWNKGIPAQPHVRDMLIKACIGKSPPNKGQPWSEETKKKMSDAKIGKRLPLSDKARMLDAALDNVEMVLSNTWHNFCVSVIGERHRYESDQKRRFDAIRAEHNIDAKTNVQKLTEALSNIELVISFKSWASFTRHVTGKECVGVYVKHLKEVFDKALKDHGVSKLSERTLQILADYEAGFRIVDLVNKYHLCDATIREKIDKYGTWRSDRRYMKPMPA